jgi:uncharacterized membrane protein
MDDNSGKVSFDNNENPVKYYSKRVTKLVNEYKASISEHLDEEYIKNTKWSERLADKIAAFGGSWNFIIVFAIFLASWLTWNSMQITPHFDPKPFILLNLILSFIAAFQAPVILMSQNRAAARDKRELFIDYAINFKAETEIDDMQAHLHRIEAELAEIKKLLTKSI